MNILLALAISQFPNTEIVRFIQHSLTANTCSTITVFINSNTRSARKLVYDLSSLDTVSNILGYDQIDSIRCDRQSISRTHSLINEPSWLKLVSPEINYE